MRDWIRLRDVPLGPTVDASGPVGAERDEIIGAIADESLLLAGTNGPDPRARTSEDRR